MVKVLITAKETVRFRVEKDISEEDFSSLKKSFKEDEVICNAMVGDFIDIHNDVLDSDGFEDCEVSIVTEENGKKKYKLLCAT